ncbi:hypothetical protein ACFLQL_00715 [Verrucomicrobiota bacterium]
MILIHYTNSGFKRINDMRDVYKNQTALLIGGAPSIKEQPLEMLSSRGVLTMAMNNAAIHFQPTLWVSADSPDCYEPQILVDPRIIKFAPTTFANNAIEKIGNKKYYMMPNINFYMQESNVPWGQFLYEQSGVPWYHNTLFVAIHILYRLGVRRIILGGSDFGFKKDNVYAHKTNLGDLEQKWNTDLYTSLTTEIKRLKPIFDEAKLELLDCSKYSQIKDVYKHISMEEAIALCLESFPANMIDTMTLPHCSKYASTGIKEQIAKWPGHHGVYEGYFKTEKTEKTNIKDKDMKPLI